MAAMTEHRDQHQQQDVRGQLDDRQSWEDALRGFLIQADADQQLEPPAASDAQVVRHRAGR